jgi:hypothetical protein
MLGHCFAPLLDMLFLPNLMSYHYQHLLSRLTVEWQPDRDKEIFRGSTWKENNTDEIVWKRYN